MRYAIGLMLAAMAMMAAMGGCEKKPGSSGNGDCETPGPKEPSSAKPPAKTQPAEKKPSPSTPDGLIGRTIEYDASREGCDLIGPGDFVNWIGLFPGPDGKEKAYRIFNKGVRVLKVGDRRVEGDGAEKKYYRSMTFEVTPEVSMQLNNLLTYASGKWIIEVKRTPTKFIPADSEINPALEQFSLRSKQEAGEAPLGEKKVVLRKEAVTASGYESKAHGGWGDFPPALTVDGDTSANSSWRAESKEGEAPQWIQFDLGEPFHLEKIRAAFVKGDSRQYDILIETSPDGKTFTPLYKGKTSGKTADFEEFSNSAGATQARYVKITGYGNTNAKFPNWINITEVQFVVK